MSSFIRLKVIERCAIVMDAAGRHSHLHAFKDLVSPEASYQRYAVDIDYAKYALLVLDMRVCKLDQCSDWLDLFQRCWRKAVRTQV
jgi:hypothetical protein